MRHHLVLAILGILAVVFAVACGEVSEAEDATASDDASTAGADASSIDSGSSAVDAFITDADNQSCNVGEVCLDDTPIGWAGPVAIGDASCPGAYPTAGGTLHTGLNAAQASCSCGCVVSSVACQLRANDAIFAPTDSCVSPPVEDSILTTTVAATCQTNNSNNIPAASWTTTTSVCEGATVGASCNGGSCYAEASGFGKLCIQRDGDHACPATTRYTERTVHNRAFDDTRACTGCGCGVSGQRCEMDLEICSVGLFEVTLKSDVDKELLNSGDGDGVSILATRVTSNGSCSTSGGVATGTVTPTMPVTTCCLP